MRLLERGPAQFNIPRDLLLRRDRLRDPGADPHRALGAGGPQPRGGGAAPQPAKFPVILAGGGVVMAHGQARRWRSPSISARRLSAATCTTTASPAATSSGCGPLGYQGSKAAMRSWPRPTWCWRSAPGSDRSAPCRSMASSTGRRRRGSIQVDPDHAHARPGQADRRRRARRCPRGRGGAPDPPADRQPRDRRPRQPRAAAGGGQARRRPPGRRSSTAVSQADGSPDRARAGAARARAGDAGRTPW